MKRAIPQLPRPDGDRVPFDRAIKENLEDLTGRTSGIIEGLEDTASLADVIAKVNEIIDRLQK
ncbi:MAG TPA: hypothetical protein VFV57_06005 [Limnobacter sp.]|nr:hypothetical protein [Limnobacter sp.]